MDKIYTTSLWGIIDRWFKTKEEAITRQKYLFEAEEFDPSEEVDQYIHEWEVNTNYHSQAGD